MLPHLIFWHLLHLTLVRLVFVHIVLDVQQVEGHRLRTYAINWRHGNQASWEWYFASTHLESELMEEGAGRVEASVQNQQLAFCLFGALTLSGFKSMTMSFHLFQGLPFWGNAGCSLVNHLELWSWRLFSKADTEGAFFSHGWLVWYMACMMQYGMVLCGNFSPGLVLYHTVYDGRHVIVYCVC